MHLREVCLTTSDLRAQESFYGGQLGLSVVRRTQETLTLAVGESRLTFQAAALDAAPCTHHFAFNIPKNKLSESRRWLLDQAVFPLTGPDDTDEFFLASWDAHMLYFSDPMGNVLELIARQELENADSSPFSSASLLNISEIGIAADDTAALRAKIADKLEASACTVYKGQAEQSFTAIGDAQGLLLLVTPGRAWYPTQNRTARACPIKVLVRGSDNRDIILRGD